MTESSLIGENQSPPEVAVSGGKFRGVGKIIRAFLLGGSYEQCIQDLEKAFRVSRRTAERIYAGQSVSGDVTLAIITHEGFGGPYLTEALSRIPAERRKDVAEALRDAADIARLNAEQEILKRKMEAKRR